MSYATVDHAAWVAASMPYQKEQVRNHKPRRDALGNAKGWHGAPDALTEFHAKVFDILGMTFGGIYNAPICWDAIQWQGWGRDAIAVPVACTSLATWDGMALTRLVFLCHEARIRCEIRANGPRGFILAFWQRQDDGGMGVRHPNLGEAAAMFREYLPADHRIIYCAPPAQVEAA